jgi:hypothetical protein
MDVCERSTQSIVLGRWVPGPAKCLAAFVGAVFYLAACGAATQTNSTGGGGTTGGGVSFCGAGGSMSQSDACVAIINSIDNNASCQDAGATGLTTACPAILGYADGGACAHATIWCSDDIDTCTTSIQHSSCSSLSGLYCSFHCE